MMLGSVPGYGSWKLDKALSRDSCGEAEVGDFGDKLPLRFKDEGIRWLYISMNHP